jgi:hypothetical protein
MGTEKYTTYIRYSIWVRVGLCLGRVVSNGMGDCTTRILYGNLVKEVGIPVANSTYLQLWLIPWELWEHMNSILHDNINIHVTACLARTNSDIQKICIKARWLLPWGIDRYEYLVGTSLTSLLQKPLSYKKAWLHATGAALGARGMTNFWQRHRQRSIHRW